MVQPGTVDLDDELEPKASSEVNSEGIRGALFTSIECPLDEAKIRSTDGAVPAQSSALRWSQEMGGCPRGALCDLPTCL